MMAILRTQGAKPKNAMDMLLGATEGDRKVAAPSYSGKVGSLAKSPSSVTKTRKTRKKVRTQGGS